MAISTQRIEAPPRRIRPFGLLHLLYAALGLAALGIIAFTVFRPITVLPRIALAPGFALLDHNGHAVTSEDMRGGITLYHFTYTDCQASCRETTAAMTAVNARLAALDSGGIPLRLVTISVDPDDDPQRLQRFRRQQGVDGDDWLFLSGAPERVRWVVGGGFGVYYQQRDDGSYLIDSAMMLVDGAGILRAEYLGGRPDVDVILRDVTLLVDEAHNSDGAARYAYEAAHLFLCYPR